MKVNKNKELEDKAWEIEIIKDEIKHNKIKV